MDPISLIVVALAQGAAVALKDTAAEAVRSGYATLVSLVRRKLGSAEDLVDEYGADPEVWEKPLTKKLADAGAQEDGELIAAARELLEQVDPAGARIGKYNVVVGGQAQVGVIGDHAQVTMNPRQPG